MYSSHISRYKTAFDTQTMPQRVIFFDGVKEENNCKKLLDENQCQILTSQSVNEYEVFNYSRYDKKLLPNSIFKVTPAQFPSLWGK